MNWTSAGYNSAIEGKTVRSEIDHYKNLCVNRHNIAINSENFAKGYEQGQAQYCTDQNLFKEGTKGNSYQGICDNHPNNKSVKSYSDGRIKFLETEVSRLESENSNLKSEISNLESKINSCTNQ